MAKEKIDFNDVEQRNAYRHTTSHILAQAVKNLWPEAKLAIGPAIENGFYYDIDLEHKITDDDLKTIEKEMKKIIKAGYPLERFELSREEAVKLMSEKGEDYKVELINDLPEDEVISFYKQGEFVDLCAGPHVAKTSEIKAVKLTSVAGALIGPQIRYLCNKVKAKMPDKIVEVIDMHDYGAMDGAKVLSYAKELIESH